VPGEESQRLLCTIRAGRQSINKAASILFIVYNARDGSTELLWSGTTFHESTLCLPDVTAHDQISQAFLLCSCISQAIKDWRWEQPGNEARIKVFTIEYIVREPHSQTLVLRFCSSVCTDRRERVAKNGKGLGAFTT